MSVALYLKTHVWVTLVLLAAIRIACSSIVAHIRSLIINQVRNASDLHCIMFSSVCQWNMLESAIARCLFKSASGMC